jgi:arylsulfatase
MNGFPAIYNIEADPREEVNILADTGWMIGQYLKIIGEYQKTLEKYPNPKAVKLTEFGK